MEQCISEETLVNLGKLAYKIIKEENLPKPIKIVFKNFGKYGIKRRLGGLIKYRKDNSYKIIIHLCKRNFIEDSNGKYYLKANKNIRYSLGEGGATIPLCEVTKTLAHEVAHLKYWNHTNNHKIYTEYILGKIYEYNPS